MLTKADLVATKADLVAMEVRIIKWNVAAMVVLTVILTALVWLIP